MKRRLFYLIAVLFAAAVVFPGFRFAGPLQADKPAASATFTIGKAFWDVEGTFREIDYQIEFDPGQPSKAKIEGVAKVRSIDTGNKKRDNELQTETWFDAANHPEIRVECIGARALGGAEFEGGFYITMKGKRLKRQVRFRVEGTGGERSLKAGFVLDREDWGVGGGAFAAVVGEEVRVAVALPF